jgi:hydroxymethylbilane synthase
MKTVRLGTRGSRLALWQAAHVREKLLECGAFGKIEVVPVRTAGDRDRSVPVARLGGKGVFVKRLEEGLLSGEIDFAVHSMKDMPARVPPQFMIAACVGGSSRNDSFLSREGLPLEKMPSGARIGTGSPRRRAQLLRVRPDLRAEPIRGNVDTRIGKMDGGEFAGLILARAGLERLGLSGRASEDLEPARMVPAAGQGVIAVEARAGDGKLIEALRAINDGEVESLAEIEFSLMRELGVGCHEPVGVYAARRGENARVLCFTGREGSPHFLRGRFEGRWKERGELGKALAHNVREEWYNLFGESYLER